MTTHLFIARARFFTRLHCLWPKLQQVYGRWLYAQAFCMLRPALNCILQKRSSKKHCVCTYALYYAVGATYLMLIGCIAISLLGNRGKVPSDSQPSASRHATVSTDVWSDRRFNSVLVFITIKFINYPSTAIPHYAAVQYTGCVIRWQRLCLACVGCCAFA